jgi:hypothetical protein
LKVFCFQASFLIIFLPGNRASPNPEAVAIPVFCAYW